MWYCVDKTGFGCLFNVKPQRDVESGVWLSFDIKSEGCLRIKQKSILAVMPKITWENEPVKVELSCTIV